MSVLLESPSPQVLRRLKKKLLRHPVLSKARVWAWVAPGNVPDPILLAVVSARLCGAELILKLSRHNEKLGRAIVCRHASKTQKIRIVVHYADFTKLAARADAWIVYGSDATLQTLKREAPHGAGWVGHGHKISCSVVHRSAFGKREARIAQVARECARDIAAHDQRGCLSPQIIWVEGDAAAFATTLHDEMRRLDSGSTHPRRDASTRRLRRAVLNELRVRALDPRELEVVSLDERGENPCVYLLKKGRFTTPAVGQVIAVKAFSTLPEIVRGMKAFLSRLQGIAVAGTSAELARVKKVFRTSSAVYFPRIGQLQTPPLHWQL